MTTLVSVLLVALLYNWKHSDIFEIRGKRQRPHYALQSPLKRTLKVPTGWCYDYPANKGCSLMLWHRGTSFFAAKTRKPKRE